MRISLFARDLRDLREKRDLRDERLFWVLGFLTFGLQPSAFELCPSNPEPSRTSSMSRS